MIKKSDHRKVQDVMTPHVVTVRPSEQFKNIVQILRTSRIGAVPVVDVSERVVGVVSETDLLPKEEPFGAITHHFFESKASRQLRRKVAGFVAADLMTTPAITVSPETDLREAARMLVERQVNHLPVVDAEGKLVGIVSRSDVLSVFAREDASIYEDVRKKVDWLTDFLPGAKVQVNVEQGVVTLTGEVDRMSDRQHLVAAVRVVDGVVGIHDLLRVWWDDTAAGSIEQALLYQSPGYGIGTGW